MEPVNPNDLSSVIRGIAREEVNKATMSHAGSAPNALDTKIQNLEARISTLEARVAALEKKST
jgi:BMFP domain-containing protein YqiC